MKTLIIAGLLFPLSAHLCLRANGSIVINEIHYHPDIETERVEFIELFNAGDGAVDLSSWYFSEGIDHTFAEGERLEAGAYYVLAQDMEAYNRKFGSIFAGGVKANAQWNGGTLSNGGETLTLRSAAGEVVDEVTFQDEFPWPVSADGGGSSMELIHPSLDNDLAGHWRASSDSSGAVSPPTPGKQNRAFSEAAPPAIRQVTHEPEAPSGSDTVIVSAKVTDPEGITEVWLDYQVVAPGEYIRLTDPSYNDPDSWTRVVMTRADQNTGADIYAVALPEDVVVHRHLIRYRIGAHDGLDNEVATPYSDDPTPNFALFVYDGIPPWTGASEPGRTPARTYTSEELSTLPVYHLIADGSDVANSQYNSSFEGRDFYGTMVYGGKVYDHMQFSNRGEFSTYQSGKNKWRFFFNRGRRFEARDNYGEPYPTPFPVMTFSACASPWVPANRGMAGMDEATAFRLYDLAGVPSPKTHHVHFRIIDDAEETGATQYESDLWGLYLVHEQPGGAFLDRLGLPDGNVYKIESGNPDKKNQGPTQVLDGSDYTTFVSDVRRPQSLEWYEENFSLHSYFGFRATNRVVGNIDIREGWNHYFYHHPEVPWHPIPWDLDMTFMPETHWSGTIDAKACLQVEEVEIAFRNRCRALLDLLYEDRSAGGGQAGSVIEELAQFVGTRRSWIDIKTMSKNGSTATVETSEPHGLTTGERVAIAGVETAGYNGSHEVTVTSETTFTYPASLFLGAPAVGPSSRVGKESGRGAVWADVDEAMWNHHPRTQGGHKGNFYANPMQQGFQGGTLTRTLATPDFGGFVEYLKDFVTDSDPDGFAVGDGDQRGYGYNYLELEAKDNGAPDRPSLTYQGADDFPLDDLRFKSGPFSGGTVFNPQSNVGLRWHLGEIYNPSKPNYDPGTAWRYEVQTVWQSEVRTELDEEMVIPVNVLRAGRTYRVRVQHSNQLGRWSRWSPAVEFIAGTPDLSGYADLIVSELMYHPGPVSEEERARGFGREDFEFLELHNRGTSSIDLSALRFTKGVDFEFATSTIVTLEPGTTVVLVSSEDAFRARYGDAPAVAGVYSGNLSNGGDRLKLSFGAGTPVIEFTYDDENGWPTSADGGGVSLVRRDLASDPDLNAAEAWAAGEVAGGTPGEVGTGPSVPLDSDRDGFSDAAEALAGTDPNDPADFLRVTRVERTADGGIGMVWTSVSGRVYEVEFSVGLTNSGDWSTIGEVTAEAATAIFEDENGGRAGNAEGYYRIRVKESDP